MLMIQNEAGGRVWLGDEAGRKEPASKHLPFRQSGHGEDEWQMPLRFPSPT